MWTYYLFDFEELPHCRVKGHVLAVVDQIEHSEQRHLVEVAVACLEVGIDLADWVGNFEVGIDLADWVECFEVGIDLADWVECFEEGIGQEGCLVVAESP